MIIIDPQEIAALADEIFTELKPPGLAIAITERDQIIHYHVQGLARIDQSDPLHGGQPFPVGSLTKSFAAAAILRLRDTHYLNLYQSPLDFIPTLAPHSFWQGVSLFHLLSMQSGLAADFAGSWAEQQLPLHNDDLSQLASTPVIPVAAPGTTYFYSNFGYMILGRVISVAAGIDARSYIKSAFLDPLKLKDTSWTAPGDNAVTGYRFIDDQYVEERSFSAENDGAVFGGIWSTLPDMAKWMSFLNSAHDPLHDGFDHILTAASRLEMQRGKILFPVDPPTVEGDEPRVRSYGFGLFNYPRVDEWAVGHTGAVPGFGCHMRWSPFYQRGVIAYANLRYADLVTGCEKILLAITNGNREPPSSPQPQLDDLVNQRAAELCNLAGGWTDGAADRLFAPNFFIDNSRVSFANKIKPLAEFSLVGSKAVAARRNRGLNGTLLVHGQPYLNFDLSPVDPGRIQDVEFVDQTVNES